MRFRIGRYLFRLFGTFAFLFMSLSPLAFLAISGYKVYSEGDYQAGLYWLLLGVIVILFWYFYWFVKDRD